MEPVPGMEVQNRFLEPLPRNQSWLVLKYFGIRILPFGYCTTYNADNKANVCQKKCSGLK